MYMHLYHVTLYVFKTFRKYTLHSNCCTLLYLSFYFIFLIYLIYFFIYLFIYLFEWRTRWDIVPPIFWLAQPSLVVLVWPECFGSFTANGIIPLSWWLADNSQNLLEKILCISWVDLKVCISNILKAAAPKFDSFVFVYFFFVCLFFTTRKQR